MPIFVPMTHASDLLDKAIEPSKQNNQVIDLWNNRNAVGNTIFESSYNIVTGKREDPLVAKITKTILRFTIMIGVTMGLFIWVRYIFAQWNEWDQKKLLGYLWNIIYGILIALASLAIVELILSITRSSITF